jgi:hypothetical protein
MAASRRKADLYRSAGSGAIDASKSAPLFSASMTSLRFEARDRGAERSAEPGAWLGAQARWMKAPSLLRRPAAMFDLSEVV